MATPPVLASEQDLAGVDGAGADEAGTDAGVPLGRNVCRMLILDESIFVSCGNENEQEG